MSVLSTGTALIGKSLGTFAVPYAAERGLPGIWLTPLTSGAAASGHVVCEIAGPDHGLEFDGDPIRSVDALRRVMATVRDYVDGLESADGA